MATELEKLKQELTRTQQALGKLWSLPGCSDPALHPFISRMLFVALLRCRCCIGKRMAGKVCRLADTLMAWLSSLLDSFDGCRCTYCFNSAPV
jgi:hypothetical protein